MMQLQQPDQQARVATFLVVKDLACTIEPADRNERVALEIGLLEVLKLTMKGTEVN